MRRMAALSKQPSVSVEHKLIELQQFSECFRAAPASPHFGIGVVWKHCVNTSNFETMWRLEQISAQISLTSRIEHNCTFGYTRCIPTDLNAMHVSITRVWTDVEILRFSSKWCRTRVSCGYRHHNISTSKSENQSSKLRSGVCSLWLENLFAHVRLIATVNVCWESNFRGSDGESNKKRKEKSTFQSSFMLLRSTRIIEAKLTQSWRFSSLAVHPFGMPRWAALQWTLIFVAEVSWFVCRNREKIWRRWTSNKFVGVPETSLERQSLGIIAVTIAAVGDVSVAGASESMLRHQTLK